MAAVLAVVMLMLVVPTLGANTCYNRLGLESRSIPDSAITSSSMYSYTYAAQAGRLNNPSSCWIAKTSNLFQWIQVDLQKYYKVTGIAMQGRHNANQWLKTYFVMYSLDGKNFQYIKSNSEDRHLFVGNTDRIHAVNAFFPSPQVARYIRIRPKTWYGYISLRFDVLGCKPLGGEIQKALTAAKPKECESPLGLSNDEIHDFQIEASAFYNTILSPMAVRLNPLRIATGGAWCGRTAVRGQYVQINLLRKTRFSGIVMQSREDYAQWVTSFSLQYLSEEGHWLNAQSPSGGYVFDGNTHMLSTVTRMLKTAVTTRSVRFMVEKWYGFPCVRFELLGCYREKSCLDKQMNVKGNTIQTSSDLTYAYSYHYAKLDAVAPSGFQPCWAPKYANKFQWIQLTMAKLTKVSGVVIQGRGNYNQWLTSYIVLHSLDGKLFSYVMDGENAIKMFKGPTNRVMHGYGIFSAPVVAKVIRIMPKTWYGYPSVRFDVVGCGATDDDIAEAESSCDTELGMRSSSVIPDSQISASSFYSANYVPQYGRVDFTTHDGKAYSWLPGSATKNQWLQVDLGDYKRIKGVITQGRGDAGQWVTSFMVMTSLKGQNFDYVRESGGNVKIFTGNKNYYDPVFNYFPEPQTRRFVRIQPWTWYSFPGLRMEVIGCAATRDEVLEAQKELKPEKVCTDQLGMESGEIQDFQISASTEHSAGLLAKYARLDRLPAAKTGGGAWCSRTNARGQYIEVNLMRNAKIRGIKIQSRNDYSQWVTSFRVQTSMDHITWVNAKGDNGQEVFHGNTALFQTTTHYFTGEIRARFVRVLPETWYGYMCMRFDILGCYKQQPCVNRQMSNNTEAITASSIYNYQLSTRYSYLDTVPQGSYMSAWCPKTSNRYQWIQLELKREQTITGVIMQGRGVVNQYVTSYYVLVSPDGKRFRYIRDGGSALQIFKGPKDRTEHAYGIFNQPSIAKFVRIVPQTWVGFVAVRFDVIGCNPTDSYRQAEEERKCDYQMGVRDVATIADSQLTANSFYSTYYEPYHGRLDYVHPNGQAYSWLPKSASKNHWIQVDLLKQANIKGVVIQGRGNAGQWVTSFGVLTSVNGHEFAYISRDDGTPILFKGNTNYYTPAYAMFPATVKARVVRINPQTWYSFPGVRFDVIGCWCGAAAQNATYVPKASCIPTKCTGALGMEDGFIKTEQLSASSVHNANLGVNNGRLNYLPGYPGNSAFCPRTARPGEWLQIDLLRPTKVTGIKMQSRGDYNQWVTSFRVMYGNSESGGMNYARNTANSEVFVGVTQPLQTVFNKFKKFATGRYFRVTVNTWYGFPCMRVELMGCYTSKVCMDYMGLKDGRIPVSSITASSSYGNNYNYGPAQARLDSPHLSGTSNSWCPGAANAYQWIQVRLPTIKRVTGVVMQGRGDASQWVTTYTISYSKDGSAFAVATNADGSIKIFKGCHDRTTHVYGVLDKPVLARAIRISPKTWYSFPSMRFEVIGCKVGESLKLPKCGGGSSSGSGGKGKGKGKA